MPTSIKHWKQLEGIIKMCRKEALPSKSLQCRQLVTISKLQQNHVRWLEQSFWKCSHPLTSPLVKYVRNPFHRKAEQWERDLLWNSSVTSALLMSILLLLILVTFSASFPNDLCWENLCASWTFTRVSCLWVSGSVAVGPWNDL